MTCEKVRYDELIDRRQNLYAFTGDQSEKIRKQAESVACFVSKQNLIKNPDTNKYTMAPYVPTLSTYIQIVHKVPLGEKEPFSQEKTLANATGSLITPDTLLTAAHVVCEKHSNSVSKSKLDDYYVVFGFSMIDADHCVTEFDEDQVYTVKKVKYHNYARVFGWQDWAFLKLDRAVTGRELLKLNWGPLQEDIEYYIVGYPTGLPIKIADGATLMRNTEVNYAEFKVDAYGGNSGSLVCRADTLEGVGVLCVGNQDYIIKHDQGVSRCVSNIMPKEVKTYEICQRVSVLELVKDYVERWSTGFKLHKIPLPITATTPGFYVFGRCSTNDCQFENQSIWIACGRGVFHLTEVKQKSTCPECKKEVTVLDLGICNSSYKIEGQLAAPKETAYREENTLTNKMKIFRQPETDFAWDSLKIKVL